MTEKSAVTVASKEKEALEHAWRYFALHATQRMSMFNFFIVAFGFASAGLAGCLRSDGPLLLAGTVIGIVLVEPHISS